MSGKDNVMSRQVKFRTDQEEVRSRLRHDRPVQEYFKVRSGQVRPGYVRT